MFIKRYFLVQISALIPILLLGVQPLGAQTSSESKRIQKLERAVAELKQEVNRLKEQAASTPEGKMKTKVTYDGKSYVEKAVVKEEKPPVFVVLRASEIKLVLGGFIQVNFEDGDVSAFEGRFGQTALKDRFRLRRARINLTGDFAENFDFKIEGDFGQGDGLNSNRLAFSATDIFVNWHQFPEAQVKKTKV
jgi:phosphate-selective porin